MKIYATIRACEQRDRDPDKPATEQKFCLFTKDGSRLLGRHPDEASAKQQEAAIHARGARTNMEHQSSKPAFVRQADSSDVAAAICPLIKEALQKYDAWFDSEAGDHYSRDFDRLTSEWCEEVAAVVYWAEESGTGDVTGLDDLVYVSYLAEILFKLSPDWETPDARENLQRDLEDIEESVMSVAFETAAHQLHGAEAQTKTTAEQPCKSKTADEPVLKSKPIRLQDLVDAAERTVEPTKTVIAALKPVDKKVVDAFMDKQDLDGTHILSTDGQVLRTMGMGGGVAVARWVDDHSVSILNEYSSRTEQSIANYMRKTVPKKMQQQHSYREAAPVEPEATIAMTSSKSGDQMVREWVRGLPHDSTGYASVWLYGMVAMDASAEEWLETAEHEGLYVPAGQRNIPYIQEFLQEELNDQTATQLDADTQAGQLGSFVYAEQDGYWGLMYETPAVEDVLAAMQKPKQQRAAVVPITEVAPEITSEIAVEATPEVAPKQQLRHQGQLYREATEEEVLARKTDRGPGRRPRGRDSRAPSMQLTQQLGKLPKEKSRREPATEEPEPSWLKRSLKWLEDKSREADVSPRARWGRLRKADAHKSIDNRNAAEQTGACKQQEYVMNKMAMRRWSFDDINDMTGFAEGAEFEHPDEVRDYFTAENMDAMMPGEEFPDQEVLDSMAEAVIENGWHMERQAAVKKAETIQHDPAYSGVGKFSSNVDEHVYGLALDGWAAETMGDVQELGHFDLVVFDPGDPLVAVYDGKEEISQAAIVSQGNQGFVHVTYYDLERDAVLAWEEIEADYEGFYRDVE